MEDMSGTIAVKARRTLNPMEKTKQPTAAELITRIIAHVKTDYPKKVDINPPAPEAIADQETRQTAIMSIIVLLSSPVTK
jgi:hypothetical protein